MNNRAGLFFGVLLVFLALALLKYNFIDYINILILLEPGKGLEPSA